MPRPCPNVDIGCEGEVSDKAKPGKKCDRCNGARYRWKRRPFKELLNYRNVLTYRHARLEELAEEREDEVKKRSSPTRTKAHSGRVST